MIHRWLIGAVGVTALLSGCDGRDDRAEIEKLRKEVEALKAEGAAVRSAEAAQSEMDRLLEADQRRSQQLARDLQAQQWQMQQDAARRAAEMRRAADAGIGAATRRGLNWGLRGNR
jgi:Skp family chaperone for outer membrane proteins